MAQIPPLMNDRDYTVPISISRAAPRLKSIITECRTLF